MVTQRRMAMVTAAFGGAGAVVGLVGVVAWSEAWMVTSVALWIGSMLAFTGLVKVSMGEPVRHGASWVLYLAGMLMWTVAVLSEPEVWERAGVTAMSAAVVVVLFHEGRAMIRSVLDDANTTEQGDE